MKRRIISPTFYLPLLFGGFVIGTTISCSAKTATLNSISTYGEVKTLYHVGDTFERPTIYAYYSNGSHKDVTLLAKFSGFSLNREGEQTVKVTYDTVSCEYDINVVNEANKLVASGVRTTFELNEEFSLGGGHVYLEYDDETREELPLSSVAVNGFDSSSVKDDGVVTLTAMIYESDLSTSYNYIVINTITDEITSLEFSNIQTEYDVGDDFVRPTATANGTIDVSDLVVYSYDLSVVGTQTVTGTFKGFSNTFEITVFSNSGVTPADIPNDSISAEFTLTTSDGTFTQEGSVYTITSSGSYTANGKLADGQIVINVPEEDEGTVEIELTGVSITSTTGCPIHAIQCKDLDISAKNNKNNYLYDHSSLKDETNDPYGAAIYVEDGDLKLKGKGTLVCISTNNNGIHGKDDVKLQKLTLSVKAVNNGIKGNDSIKIAENVNVDIVCGNDGLKTSNTQFKNEKQKGNIEISSGNICINSYADGIDAAYDAIISEEPVIDIYTNAYSTYSSSAIPTGTYTKSLLNRATSIKASDSAKGIKACNEINISGGTIYTETYDDGVHGNATSDDEQIVFENGDNAPGNVVISGGKLTVSATDDGVHADGTLTITDNADITVLKSYEGLEGHIINMDGGKAVVTANDDGVNATSTNSYSKDGEINISGGYLDVTVPGSGDVDGIDSNGTYTQSGGVVIVRGPTEGGAWSLDTDGNVYLKGGTIIVVGGIEASSSGSGGWGGRPGPGGPGGGGAPGGGTLSVASNMTKSTSTTGMAKKTFKVTFANSDVIVTYTNTYSYSKGSVIIYSELGSATVTIA